VHALLRDLAVKRVGALVTLVAIAALGYALLRSDAQRGAASSAAAREAGTAVVARQLAARTFLGPSNAPASEQRAAIWDAPDLLATARAALDHGTRDERQWAGDVVRECHGVLAPPISQEVAGAAGAALIAEAERRRPPEAQKAKTELIERCKSVGTLSDAERIALWRALWKSAEPESGEQLSAAQRLRRLGPPTAWSDEDRAAVAAALYGSDPLLRLIAARALFLALDAPRKDALLLVVDIGHATTQFEWLEQQASGNPVPETPEGSADPELRRLADAYRAAFANKVPVQELLAIR